MKTDFKGNTVNFAFINNTIQANTEVNTNISVENKAEIKGGLVEFVKACIGNKTLHYIGEYKYSKAKYEYELNERMQSIPEKYITQPRLSILGPVMDNLRYNLDEEHIREMFTNILLSEVDERKQKKVLPSYTEIIKQLSKEDALFLKEVANYKNQLRSAIRVFKKEKKGIQYQPIEDCIVLYDSPSKSGVFIIPGRIVLDNLERINIVKIHDDKCIPVAKDYNRKAFEQIKEQFLLSEEEQATYEITYLDLYFEVTEFGQQFIDICCS